MKQQFLFGRNQQAHNHDRKYLMQMIGEEEQRQQHISDTIDLEIQAINIECNTHNRIEIIELHIQAVDHSKMFGNILRW